MSFSVIINHLYSISKKAISPADDDFIYGREHEKNLIHCFCLTTPANEDAGILTE